MESVLGIFSSRAGAEQAVQGLLATPIAPQAIIRFHQQIMGLEKTKRDDSTSPVNYFLALFLETIVSRHNSRRSRDLFGNSPTL